MKRIVCLVLTMLFLCGCAFAEVHTTGNVNLRVGPGLGFEVVSAVPADTVLKYAGGVSVDERGVEWYAIVYNERVCWISSKYSDLYIQNPAPVVLYAGSGIELSGYYGQNLVEAAQAAGLVDYVYEQSEVPNCYFNDCLTFAGNDCVSYISLTGEGYAIFGCEIGMDMEMVADLMRAAGLSLSWGDGYVCVFEHPADEDSFMEGFDSCINVCFDETGVVTGLDWSTYTG